MDTETLLYQKLDKYGDEQTQVNTSDLYRDIDEIVNNLKPLSGFDLICEKMKSFLRKTEFSKDDVVDIIIKAIHKIEMS